MARSIKMPEQRLDDLGLISTATLHVTANELKRVRPDLLLKQQDVIINKVLEEFSHIFNSRALYWANELYPLPDKK